MKNFTLVVSAPRSGSSCTAGCLSLCGLSLGKNVATVKDEFNEKGYFENKSILNFNRKVLDEIGVNVFCKEVPSEKQIEKSLNFKQELIQLINDEFTEVDCVIKDPRIAILHDLYLESLKQHNVKCVLLARSKPYVANSIQRMRKMELVDAAQVVDVYELMMNELSEKSKCVRLKFEDLISSPIECLENIGCLPNDSQKNSIRHFVEERLIKFK